MFGYAASEPTLLTASTYLIAHRLVQHRLVRKTRTCRGCAPETRKPVVFVLTTAKSLALVCRCFPLGTSEIDRSRIARQ